MNNEYTKVIEEIAAEVLQLSRSILGNDGIASNQKSGKNTLRDSALAKNVEVEVSNSGNSVIVKALFDNYIDYIEAGRKPRTGKQPPIDALRDWALNRGIPTDNSTLFLISRAIWRDGYEGRPILATLEEEIEKLFDDKWAEQLLEALTEELIF